VQPLNAAVPIDFTLFGIITDIRDLHPWKAKSGINVTVFGIMTDTPQGNGETVGLIDTDLLIGVEVGVRERGSELHVFRPESAQAGYTQAGVK